MSKRKSSSTSISADRLPVSGCQSVCAEPKSAKGSAPCSDLVSEGVVLPTMTSVVLALSRPPAVSCRPHSLWRGLAEVQIRALRQVDYGESWARYI